MTGWNRIALSAFTSFLHYTMPESQIHFDIKNAVAKALSELGYSAQVEKRFQDGIMDICVTDSTGKEIEIEIHYTHAPDRFRIRITDDSIKQIHMKKEHGPDTRSYRIVQRAKYLEELYYAGKYKKPLSSICSTIVAEYRAMGNYEISTLVRKTLDDKYKDQKFTPTVFRNRTANMSLQQFQAN